MASILEVINGISQAIAGKHEGGGAQIGLKRETEDLLQGCSIYDPRIMDGFGVQYQGNMLILKYHSEMPLTKIHDKNFETDIRQTMKDIKKFIEKEYRRVTKKSLSLTEYGDTNILVQSANRRTSYINATQTYVINDVDGYSKEDSKPQENYSDIAKRWLMNCRKPKTYLKENKNNKKVIYEAIAKQLETSILKEDRSAIVAMALALSSLLADPAFAGDRDIQKIQQDASMAVKNKKPSKDEQQKAEKIKIELAKQLQILLKGTDLSQLAKDSPSDITKALQGAGTAKPSDYEKMYSGK